MSRRRDLPADLLDRPVAAAARNLVLDALTRVETTLPRLARGDDPEALHDLRVALRRLRALLRAYRPELAGAVGRQQRRLLKRLAGSTNAARDAEVGLALLDGLAVEAAPPERRAIAFLAAKLGERRAEASRRLDGEPLADLAALAGNLRTRVGSLGAEPRPDRGPAAAPRQFRSALAKVVAREVEALAAALEAARESGAPAAAHRARLTAKRVRYLIEPLVPLLPAARGPVRKARALQDDLGAAQDLAVLSAALAEVAAEAEQAWISALAAGERPTAAPGGRSGRAALARRLARRRADLGAELGRRWLGRGAERGSALVAELRSLVARLG